MATFEQSQITDFPRSSSDVTPFIDNLPSTNGSTTRYHFDSDNLFSSKPGMTEWNIFYLISVPCLAVAGIIGNALTIAAIRKGKFLSPTYYYIRALAGLYIFGLLVQILLVVPSCLICPRRITEHCFFALFVRFVVAPLGNVPVKTSNWVACLLVIDRVIAIQRPVSPTTINRHPRRFFLVVVIASVISNIPEFVNFYVPSTEGSMCRTKFNSWYNSFNHDVWKKIDSSLFTYIPLVIIPLSSAAVLVNVCLSRKHSLPRKQFRQTLMVMTPAFLFCITRIPMIGLTLWRNTFANIKTDNSVRLYQFHTFEGILLCIDCGAMFYICMIVSLRFRSAVVGLFKTKRTVLVSNTFNELGQYFASDKKSESISSGQTDVSMSSLSCTKLDQ